MPVVVVASFTAKPESVDAVRASCKKAIEAVHDEPGCQLYSLHEANGTFVFVEQWADADAAGPQHRARDRHAVRRIGEHLDAPRHQMLTPIVAGDPAKGQLRA